nr:MAG TPA: hypothetical protein [Caudoviricetes sp.]
MNVVKADWTVTTMACRVRMCVDEVAEVVILTGRLLII